MGRTERRRQERKLRKLGMQTFKLNKMEQLALKGIQAADRELAARQQQVQSDFRELNEAVAEHYEISVDDIGPGKKYNYDFSTYLLVEQPRPKEIKPEQQEKTNRKNKNQENGHAPEAAKEMLEEVAKGE